MDDNMPVQYPFFSVRYRTYIRIQTLLVGALLVAAGAFYVEARDHHFWLWAHAWWMLLLVAAAEVVESFVAITRARRIHERDNDGTGGTNA